MFRYAEKRYMTNSVVENLHPEIQGLLWSLIDQRDTDRAEVDSLLVFELYVFDSKQGIRHRQEQLPLEQHWLVELQDTEPITSTIWFIDQGKNGQIMLYPSDY